MLLVNSYGLNGIGDEAIQLFSRMPKELIKESTFICVLNACSHAGLVDQGLRIFKDITNKTERIFTTMVSRQVSRGHSWKTLTSNDVASSLVF